MFFRHTTTAECPACDGQLVGTHLRRKLEPQQRGPAALLCPACGQGPAQGRPAQQDHGPKLCLAEFHEQADSSYRQQGSGN